MTRHNHEFYTIGTKTTERAYGEHTSGDRHVIVDAILANIPPDHLRLWRDSVPHADYVYKVVKPDTWEFKDALDFKYHGSVNSSGQYIYTLIGEAEDEPKKKENDVSNITQNHQQTLPADGRQQQNQQAQNQHLNGKIHFNQNGHWQANPNQKATNAQVPRMTAASSVHTNQHVQIPHLNAFHQTNPNQNATNAHVPRMTAASSVYTNRHALYRHPSNPCVQNQYLNSPIIQYNLHANPCLRCFQMDPSNQSRPTLTLASCPLEFIAHLDSSVERLQGRLHQLPPHIHHLEAKAYIDTVHGDIKLLQQLLKQMRIKQHDIAKVYQQQCQLTQQLYEQQQQQQYNNQNYLYTESPLTVRPIHSQNSTRPTLSATSRNDAHPTASTTAQNGAYSTPSTTAQNGTPPTPSTAAQNGTCPTPSTTAQNSTPSTPSTTAQNDTHPPPNTRKHA